MEESTKLNTRGKTNALTIICDFTWSYPNYFCCYGDLSFFILGGSHRKVILNKEGAMNKKVNRWSQSIKNLMYITKLNIAGKFRIHNLISYSIFFRIIELPILWILSIDYVYIRFSSKKTPLPFSMYCHARSTFVPPQNPRKSTARSEPTSG